MRDIDFSGLDTCAQTGKKCLTNAQAAELIRIYKKKSQLHGRKRIPTRAYFCYECGWWHVTSERDRERVKELPNFDADIFYEISGIRV